MPKRAILYIAVIVCIGAASVLQAALNWKMQDPYLFFGLLVLAVCLSTMKITLPRMTGTMSGAFVPVLASIALLSSDETVVIAGVSGLVQSVWRARRRPMVAQVAFNCAALSISALAAYRLSHWSGTGIVNGSVAAILVLAAATDYLVNGLLVSAVLCLVERKSLFGIFSNCNLWALPYYFVGAVIVGALVNLRFAPNWYVVLPALPIMWTVHNSYRQYVGRMECSQG